MTDHLFRDLLPSTGVILAVAGIVMAVVGGVLVNVAARAWRQQSRERQLRDHVARVEARWHEAAM
jgi:hypothetical protein